MHILENRGVICMWLRALRTHATGARNLLFLALKFAQKASATSSGAVSIFLGYPGGRLAPPLPRPKRLRLILPALDNPGPPPFSPPSPPHTHNLPSSLLLFKHCLFKPVYLKSTTRRARALSFNLTSSFRGVVSPYAF
jgi:hypothetical protein